MVYFFQFFLYAEKLTDWQTGYRACWIIAFLSRRPTTISNLNHFHRPLGIYPHNAVFNTRFYFKVVASALEGFFQHEIEIKFCLQ